MRPISEDAVEGPNSLSQTLLKFALKWPKNDRYCENHKNIKPGPDNHHRSRHDASWHRPYRRTVAEITTATITGVMGTTLAGVNATTPTEVNVTTPTGVTAPATGRAGIMAANITTADTTPTTLPSL